MKQFSQRNRFSTLLFTSLLVAGNLSAQDALPAPEQPSSSSPSNPPTVAPGGRQIPTRSTRNQTPQPAPDPLQYFQQNPELMKRYFPHLANQNAHDPANPSTPLPEIEKTFSIAFPGGTPSDLMHHLSEAMGTAPNVIIAPSMQNVELPEFSLQNVTLADVFQALNNLGDANKKGSWQLSGSNEPIWVLNPNQQQNPYGMPQSIDPLTGAPIDPLTGQPINRAEKNCLIFPVSSVLTEFTIEDITTAVQTAWNMMGNESGAEIKFHKDTELLIAVGNHRQLEVIQQVLKSLGQRITQGKQASGSAKEQKDAPESSNQN